MREVVFPPALRPGDTVHVIAPSGPFDHLFVWRGLGWLRERYRVRFDRKMFSRTGYLAGDDDRRRGELEVAFGDPEVRAIIAARGGYGASRFCHRIDWSRFAESPRWITGFSDVTALHVEAAALGVASMHGPNLTALGRGDEKTRSMFRRALEEPLHPIAFRDLEGLEDGVAEGPLFGGNLTLLHACAAAGRLRVPEHAILFIEDVTEKPYRVDRVLTTLALGGHFDRIAAVVAGEFTECHPGPDRVTVESVLRDRLEPLGIPVVFGAPIGHGTRNEPVVLGRRTRVEVSQGRGSVIMASGA